MLGLGTTNPFAVMASALAGFLLGAVWYSPALLGKPWMKALGKTKEGLMGPALPLAVNLVSALIVSLALALTVRAFGAHTGPAGGGVGLLVGLCFTAANMISNYISAGSSLKLYLIDAGYRVVSMGVMGAMLGAWR